MNLHDLFYIVSIIFMVSMLVILVGIGIIAYRIHKKVSRIKKIATSPAATAAEISAGIIDGVSLKIQEVLRSRQKSSRR